MDAVEAIIRKLCMDCGRRGEICSEHLPTYSDAYKCKWDEAQQVFKKMSVSFKEE